MSRGKFLAVLERRFAVLAAGSRAALALSSGVVRFPNSAQGRAGLQTSQSTGQRQPLPCRSIWGLDSSVSPQHPHSQRGRMPWQCKPQSWLLAVHQASTWHLKPAGAQLQSQGQREMIEEGWRNKAPLSPHPSAAALPWHSGKASCWASGRQSR